MKYLIFTFMLFFSFSVNAQRITGQVIDENGNAISGVVISADNTTFFTNSDGNFSFSPTIKLLVFDFGGLQPITVLTDTLKKDDLKIVFNTMGQKIIIGRIIDVDSCGIPGALILVNNIIVVTMSNFDGYFTLLLNKDYHNTIFTVRSSVYNDKEVSVKEIERDSIIILDEKVDVYKKVVLKPIIYLYPKHETIIDIKLNFNGQLTNTYPDYDNGWQVIANPNGDLINKNDNSLHRYLFWDGINDESVELPNFETGFVVKNDEVLAFLDSSLTKIGLNQYEKNDFITFWMPIMKNNEYNLVHFLIDDECNEVATLNVNPKPESEIRVYILFKEIAEPVNITPQILETVDRNGFVLVEWGGIKIENIDFSN